MGKEFTRPFPRDSRLEVTLGASIRITAETQGEGACRRQQLTCFRQMLAEMLRSHPLGHCHLFRSQHLAKQSPFPSVCQRCVIRYHSLSGILSCKDQEHLGLPSAVMKGGQERKRKRKGRLKREGGERIERW